MLTPSDLQDYMEQNVISGEILFLDELTPTVEAAAQALGTEPDKIVKSVLFTVGEKVVLAITCGTRFVEQRAIAARFGVGRKKVKLAPAEIVLKYTGYPVGTVPPFGHYLKSLTLIDPSVLEMGEVFAGGGDHNAMVRLNPQDILRVTEAEIVDLHTRPA